jgi:hypothetical protein
MNYISILKQGLVKLLGHGRDPLSSFPSGDHGLSPACVEGSGQPGVWNCIQSQQLEQKVQEWLVVPEGRYTGCVRERKQKGGS